jgi:dTDP-4-dehydrorhamnose 3,5-epimerase
VYPALSLGDPTAAIPWPIPLDEADISEKDRSHPVLARISPVPPMKTLIIGSKGQLGRALQHDFPAADLVDLDTLDVTDPAQVAAWPWHEYALVLNAAAYTAVDSAESPEGRVAAWAANAQAPATLARLASEHRFTLVHYSSDYVFDGTTEEHREDEPLSPLGVYGQSKAAGDLAVSTARRHYLVRTSWVIGDGKNFVRTMQELARDGVSPSVVDDQIGRLTFTPELSRATAHLVSSEAPFGTYNCTNSGPASSWADVARAVFAHSGRSPEDVTGVSTAEYSAGKDVAPRPANSSLALDRIRATGFDPKSSLSQLERYLRTE